MKAVSMNNTNHKRYSKEFKDSSAQLALSGTASIVQTARDLGLSDNTLYNWISEYRKANKIQSNASLNRTPEQQEIINLKKELARSRQECEIFKKGDGDHMRYSSKQSFSSCVLRELSLSCEGSSVKYAWILKYESKFDISMMCRLLSVKRSGYYHYKKSGIVVEASKRQETLTL